MMTVYGLSMALPDLVSWWDATKLTDCFNRMFDCSITVQNLLTAL